MAVLEGHVDVEPRPRTAHQRRAGVRRSGVGGGFEGRAARGDGRHDEVARPDEVDDEVALDGAVSVGVELPRVGKTLDGATGHAAPEPTCTP